MTRALLHLLFLLSLARPGPAATLRITLQDEKGKPVEDVVVSLVRADGPMPAVQPMSAVEIIQKDQQFGPYVTAVTVGTPVTFPNKDTVQHHVYSLSKPKKFEFPLYMPGKAETIVFDQPGIVTIGCNIHDWMLAYLVVLPTPWFAKTDARGVAVAAAPPGKFRLEVWHPRLGTPVSLDVTLSDSEPQPIQLPLSLKPDRRVRRLTEGKPGGY